jgi:fructose-1,6-bisphosphatase
LPSQKSKPVSVAQTTIAISPTPAGNNLLSVDNPKDEDVSSQKIITVHGKTVSGATVIVSSEDTDQVVKPASNGDFSLTLTLPDGTSLLTITAVLPDGQEKKLTRTVTYSSENF